MSTRKLVDINDENYKGLQKLRDECKKHNTPLVPTMPQLVNMAIKNQLPSLFLNFLPDKKTKRFNG